MTYPSLTMVYFLLQVSKKIKQLQPVWMLREFIGGQNWKCSSRLALGRVESSSSMALWLDSFPVAVKVPGVT